MGNPIKDWPKNIMAKGIRRWGKTPMDQKICEEKLKKIHDQLNNTK